MTRRYLHLASQCFCMPALAIGTALWLSAPLVAQESASPPAPPQPSETDSDSSSNSNDTKNSSDSKNTSDSESDDSPSSSQQKESQDKGSDNSATNEKSSASRDSARSGRSDNSSSDSDDDDRSSKSRDTARTERDRSSDDDSTSEDRERSSSRESARSNSARSGRDSDRSRDNDEHSASSRRDSSFDRDSARDRSQYSDRRDRSAADRPSSRDADDDRYSRTDRDDRINSSRNRSTTRDDDYDRDDRYSSRDADDGTSARDRLRDDVRETARDVRDTMRSARDTARETVQDARSTARSLRNSASSSTRQEFDVNSVRAADVGLWFNRSTSNGLVISDVGTSGPIARLGFREGDRIVSVDGYRVNSERQFVQDLFYDDIRNDRVPIVVNRNGTQRTLYVEPATLVEHYTSSQHDPMEQFGLVLDDRYADRLVVWKTIPRTPAYYAGVRKGDVITAWDNTRLTRPDQLVQLVEQAEESGDHEARLTVYRGQQPRQLEVEFPQLASRDSRTSYRPVLEQDAGTYAEPYPAVEATRPSAVERSRILPRPGILPRNR